MTRIEDIVRYLEQIAPLAYQEGYDNAGLVVGELATPVTGILICLDITESVIEEAKVKNCNLIIAHHPIIFRPISKLTSENYVGRCITHAIKQDIALYGLHTNLDNLAHGVNEQIAKTLCLDDLTVLLPKTGTLRQLTTFVPYSSVDSVLQALHAAGAGHMGDYTHCSFVAKGTGSFRPTSTAYPYIGTVDKPEKVEEGRIEVIFPAHLETPVLQALRATHPYEEVAYYVHKLSNTDPKVGAGMIGELPSALHSQEFLAYLKAKMQLAYIRHTTPIGRPVKRVAVCGGSGSFLIEHAILKHADVLVTSDVKYHDFFKADGQMIIADIGHYESEVGVKALIYTLLSKKFTNIVLLKCETITNPIYCL